MEQVIKECRDLFKQHSVTYYYSTLLFPRHIRHNVYILYAFVRLADEYVDNPQKGEDPATSLQHFRDLFEMEWQRKESGNPITSRFVLLAKEFEFDKEWVDAFLDSMEIDIYKKRYHTFEELEQYIYGSAEVIGLMMNRVMGLSAAYDIHARTLGKSMQLINFLRDVQEDSNRGRIYFPLIELGTFGITEAHWLEIDDDKHTAFVNYQISRIRNLQTIAEKAMPVMPFRVRKAVTLASEGYLHTLHKIEKTPLLPFTQKISNTKKDIFHVFLRTILHS